MVAIESSAAEYVAVSADSIDSAGATVWWRLSGSVTRDDLLSALMGVLDESFDPPSVSPEVAVRRAAAKLRGRRRLLRPIKRGSWAIVEEGATTGPDGESLRHWVGPTVSLDIVGGLVIRNASQEEEESAVRTEYASCLVSLTTEDVSSWLTGSIRRLWAVALRDSGGIYYVPPSSMSTMRALIRAVSDACPSHIVYTMPTVKLTADGARALMDSLQSEIDRDARQINDDVVSGALGTRALGARGERADDLLTKVERYELLLGERLENVRDTLSNLKATVAAAKLAAEEDEDQ